MVISQKASTQVLKSTVIEPPLSNHVTSNNMMHNSQYERCDLNTTEILLSHTMGNAVDVETEAGWRLERRLGNYNEEEMVVLM